MALVDKNKLYNRPIPHESDPVTGEGEWIKFCRMTHTELADARRIRAEQERREMADFGGDVVTAMGEAGQRAQQKAKEEGIEIETDPYAPGNFDRDTVLEASIKEWSYGVDVTPASIGDLDEPTAAWAHRESVKITSPPTGEEGKES